MSASRWPQMGLWEKGWMQTFPRLPSPSRPLPPSLFLPLPLSLLPCLSLLSHHLLCLDRPGYSVSDRTTGRSPVGLLVAQAAFLLRRMLPLVSGGPTSCFLAMWLEPLLLQGTVLVLSPLSLLGDASHGHELATCLTLLSPQHLWRLGWV